MRITEFTVEDYQFKELSDGDTFINDCGNVFLKTEVFIDRGSGMEFNAVLLINGKMCSFGEEEFVLKCDRAKVVIE